MTKLKFLLAKNICTLFGLGFVSKMPGTLGSLVALLIGLLILISFSYIFFIVFFIILLVISLYTVFIYQTKVGKSDKSEIVIDEVLGQLIPLAFINFNYLEIILAFLLFRIFDIIKFFPANIIDKKYSNHYGVIFDDIIAGIQATITLLIIINLYDKF